MASHITITDVMNLNQFATSHKWNLKFVTTPTKYGTTGPALTGLNVRCESVTLPKVTTPSVEIVIRGHKVKQAGIADYGNTITLTLFETTDMYVNSVIDAWRNICWQHISGIQQNKEEYSCQIQLERLDNKQELLQTYNLYNCYMEDNDVGGDLDATTADPLKPTITLSFDYFTVVNSGRPYRGLTDGSGKTA